VASTADSGKSWSVWTFTDTLAFHGVEFADSLIGVMVGHYGRAYRTTNGDALWAIQSMPTRSHLNLGREVAVLVHQPQTPGSYSVQSSASGLASGMYVYRLSIDGAATAQSMMVLK
jgi:hypothetical protein